MVQNKSKTPKSAMNMFFSGVVVLTIANILVKCVGLILKIVLNTVVGSVGAGYYSSAYEIYAFLYVIATSGLPVALSIMISKCRAQGKLKEARKIFNVAMILFFIIGTVFAVLLIAFSQKIANLISAPETAISIVAIAPTILFICLSSCLRGYFQGYQLMNPTGVSQFIEALGKAGIGFACALWAKAQGYEDHVVAAFTILGVTSGVFLGMVFLFIRKIFFKEKTYYDDLGTQEAQKTKYIFKDLTKIAIPITLSSCVLSLTVIIDTLMVQSRLLASGLGEDLVRIYYGDYTTLVISMINLPTILIYPISNALVPLITGAIAKNDQNKAHQMRSFTLRVINILSIPCALSLAILSRNLLELLMFTESSVNRAAPWLSLGSVAVIFLGLISATNAFLNTAGKQKYPIISMVCGAVVKVLANYFLVGHIGILGAPLSTVLCYLTAATMNIFFTVKCVGRLPDIKKMFFMPLLCAIISIGSGAGVYLILDNWIPSRLATLVAIIVILIVYLFMIVRSKTVSEDEVKMLPHGNKIRDFLKKMHFFPKKC
ncbi:MAG: polysaccharide biosynthesis protein [Clostridia bacterium]|nr:polysaccharide biosynthesis protein [Clostridia bacterium]